MKCLNEILYINEDSSDNKWYLSFLSPMFVNDNNYIEISKNDAIKLLNILKKEEDNKIDKNIYNGDDLTNIYKIN